MMRLALAAILIASAAPLSAAQPDPASPSETRTAKADAPRPAAQLTELAWLVGHWQGEGIEGAPAMEQWAAPIGGAMPGVFVQTDGKGGTMFSEYMQIVPDGDSLMVRLKHFNADLTGWEEKDKTVTFPLISKARDAFYFNGLTYRKLGANQLLVAVKVREDDGSVQELKFRFKRVRR